MTSARVVNLDLGKIHIGSLTDDDGSRLTVHRHGCGTPPRSLAKGDKLDVLTPLTSSLAAARSASDRLPPSWRCQTTLNPAARLPLKICCIFTLFPSPHTPTTKNFTTQSQTARFSFSLFFFSFLHLQLSDSNVVNSDTCLQLIASSDGSPLPWPRCSGLKLFNVL